jgi:hypothetical protein
LHSVPKLPLLTSQALMSLHYGQVCFVRRQTDIEISLIFCISSVFDYTWIIAGNLHLCVHGSVGKARHRIQILWVQTCVHFDAPFLRLHIKHHYIADMSFFRRGKFGGAFSCNPRTVFSAFNMNYWMWVAVTLTIYSTIFPFKALA